MSFERTEKSFGRGGSPLTLPPPAPPAAPAAGALSAHSRRCSLQSCFCHPHPQ